MLKKKRKIYIKLITLHEKPIIDCDFEYSLLKCKRFEYKFEII